MDLNSVLELFNPNVFFFLIKIFFISIKNTYLLGSLISMYFLVFVMETSRFKSFSNHYRVIKKKALVLKIILSRINYKQTALGVFESLNINCTKKLLS